MQQVIVHLELVTRYKLSTVNNSPSIEIVLTEKSRMDHKEWITKKTVFFVIHSWPLLSSDLTPSELEFFILKDLRYCLSSPTFL